MTENINSFLEEKGWTISTSPPYNWKDHYVFTDKDNYRFVASVSNIVDGRTPKIIDRRNPYAIHNINNWLVKHGYSLQTSESSYENNETKMHWNDEEGNIYIYSWKNIMLMHKNQKLILSDCKRSTNKRETNYHILSQEFIFLLAETPWCAEGTYRQVNENVVIKHQDGYIAETTLFKLRQQRQPLILSKKYGTNNMYLLVANNSDYVLKKEQVFNRSKSRYVFICSKHGEFKSSIKTIIDKNHHCPQCIIENPELESETRSSIEYHFWRKMVLEHYNHTCMTCGSKHDLHAHHKDGFHWCKKRRFDIDNGACLCKNCHVQGLYSFHAIYGKSNNTEKQFQKWLEFILNSQRREN